MAERLPRVLATAAATVASVIAGAGPAAALNGTYTSGDPLNLGLALLYFVGIPVVVFAVIGLFTVGYQRGVGALRYRPGRAWAYGTDWFGYSDLNDHATPLTSPGGTSGSW